MDRILSPVNQEFALEYRPEDQKLLGPCPHCGEMTSRIWGYAYRSDSAIAAYFVEWTPGHPEAAATFDLIVGEWGENADSSSRVAISLDFRKLDSGPSFMVQDARTRNVGSSSLVSKALDRSEVIGAPLAELTFAICDLIYFADPRLQHLRS